MCRCYNQCTHQSREDSEELKAPPFEAEHACPWNSNFYVVANIFKNSLIRNPPSLLILLNLQAANVNYNHVENVSYVSCQGCTSFSPSKLCYEEPADYEVENQSSSLNVEWKHHFQLGAHKLPRRIKHRLSPNSWDEDAAVPTGDNRDGCVLLECDQDFVRKDVDDNDWNHNQRGHILCSV